ncbi:MAG: GNAT family N-acetyltransferase [Pseudomonadota bacterium]
MLRVLDFEDMDQVAVLQRQVRDHALPWIKVLHTPEEDRQFFRGHVFSICKLWGCFENEQLVGFIAFRQGWIDHLYVRPETQQRGVGTRLLSVALRPSQNMMLWTFQRNTSARHFYEKRGFVLVKETDGQGNEEKEPDALYSWQATSRPEAR